MLWTLVDPRDRGLAIGTAAHICGQSWTQGAVWEKEMTLVQEPGRREEE